jgi:hypothetical protein
MQIGKKEEIICKKCKHRLDQHEIDSSSTYIDIDCVYCRNEGKSNYTCFEEDTEYGEATMKLGQKFEVKK